MLVPTNSKKSANLILRFCLCCSLFNLGLVSPTIIAPHEPASPPDLRKQYSEFGVRNYDEFSNNLQLQRHPIQPNWPVPRQPVQERYVTKTVSGFMDFVTTVGNTVMVFTPAGLGISESISNPRTRNPTAQSTLIVTPTRVVPRFDDQPTIGIEGLFQDFQRPPFDSAESQRIQPSSVKRENNLIDLEGAIEENQDFEPQVTQPLQEPSTVTRVASTTLRENFILVDGQPDVGLVTATGGTLIANGVTTVHTTRVFGTYLNGGNYAQVVQSTAKIFEEEFIKATPVAGFAGSVQHVTEKPGFGLQVAENQQPSKDDLPLETLFKNNNIDDSDDDEAQTPTGIASRIQQRIALKKSSQNDFRSRLKSRFDRFKARQSEENIGRGSVSQISVSGRAGFGRSTSGFRGSRERSRGQAAEDRRGTSAEVTTIEPEFDSVEETIGSRAPRQRFRDRSRIRGSPSRIRPVTIKLEPESVEELLGNTKSSEPPRFGSRNRNRFRDRVQATRRQETRLTTTTQAPSKVSFPSGPSRRPDNEFKDRKEQTGPTAPRLSIKKFNRFSRPDIRKSLLQKILAKGRGQNAIDPEDVEKSQDLESNDLEEELGDGDITTSDNTVNDDIVVNELNPLQTTLRVSTVYPESQTKVLPGKEETMLEVATIRSPYSFAIEEGMSTRFITVTRTFTNTIKPTADPASIAPTSSKPLFQTETIPAPENILTSSGPEYTNADLTDLSSSIETLPAIIIASQTHATPALKTITETYSSTELMLKTSILPIVVNGNTKLHTVTQSYYLTRLIEAVKTLPPLEFIPTSAFTDFDNVLEEAGSEKHEQLLPGELEFSDQDDFSSLEGPHEFRVKPPPGFKEDLDLLGSKFENQEQQQQPQLQLQSSIDQASQINPFANLLGGLGGLGQLNNQQTSSVSTPNLPNQFSPSFNPLAGLSQEQLQQLALLTYLKNPNIFGNGFGANLGNLFGQQQQQPQQQIQSTPVYRTETLYSTSTIPLFLGAKKFFTTLTQAVGVTTITEYETSTQQVNNANGFGNFNQNNFNQNQNQNQQNQQQLFAAPKMGGGGFVVTSEPVIRDTQVPSTIYKEIRITFRNTPTVTTLTTTSLVQTQITSYVTRTVRNQQTLGAGAGFGGFNPLAALLG